MLLVSLWLRPCQFVSDILYFVSDILYFVVSYCILLSSICNFDDKQQFVSVEARAGANER